MTRAAAGAVSARGQRVASRPAAPSFAEAASAAAMTAAAQSAFLSAFLRGASGPEADAIRELVALKHAPNTKTGYAQKFGQFRAFCLSRGLCPLPADTRSVALWIAAMLQSRKVQPSSLRPYLAAVNDAHRAGGFEPPAQGAVLHAMRRGAEHRRAVEEPGSIKDARLPFPAAAALKALQALDVFARFPAAALAIDPAVVRSLLYVALGFQLMARADTDVGLKRDDVVISADGLGIRLRNEKGKRHLPTRRILHLRQQDAPLLCAAATTWARVRTAAFAAAQARSLAPPPPNASYWLLPGERLSSPSATCGAWLKAACAYLRVQAPMGGVYLPHSLRSGPASACNAIGVALPSIRHWGGWARSSAVVNDYIDPTVRADAAAYIFFGWMLPAPPPPAASPLAAPPSAST